MNSAKGNRQFYKPSSFELILEKNIDYDKFGRFWAKNRSSVPAARNLKADT